MIRKVLGWLTVGVSLVLAGDFQQPPEDCKIMMRWWWFGPAVTKAGLEHEMRLMKEGGIGGFEVQPTYPLTLDNAKTGLRNLPYLSDEFLSALRFTSGKARELGLRMDLTGGSGWPYGGPQVAVDQAAGRLRTVRVRADGPARRVPLPDLESGEEFLSAFAAPSTGGAVTRTNTVSSRKAESSVLLARGVTRTSISTPAAVSRIRATLLQPQCRIPVLHRT